MTLALEENNGAKGVKNLLMIKVPLAVPIPCCSED